MSEEESELNARQLRDRLRSDVEAENARMITRAVGYVCVTLVLIALIIVGGYHFTNRVAIEKGLCQGAIPGTTGWQWVACK